MPETENKPLAQLKVRLKPSLAERQPFEMRKVLLFFFLLADNPA
jgi:hypothetical protein